MAKSVLNRGEFALHTYPAFTPAGWRSLPSDLARFAQAPEPDRGYRSFVAVFDGDVPPSEEAFEGTLWSLLRSLHARDDATWDPSVSDDPNDPTFSFAGRAFYVIGMHPNASRPARRFERPMAVFNLHEQFERLRQEGRYAKVKALIRDRDRALAGSVNPMMADFGERSEARQYSGRAVEAEWRCPFHP